MTSTVMAPAKLTLSLRVTGVRSDGYHLIDAEMVTLDFADVVHIDSVEPESETQLSASGPYCAGMPLDASNLAAKALRLCGRSARVHIDKHIPHGGGLGGGSADAAAVLRWAGFDDLTRAAGIGADIAFCLVGGRARVRGIGEVIEPLAAQPQRLTLILPPLACSTPAVYRAWDRLGEPTGDHFNDLEPAVIELYPQMAAWRTRIETVSGQRPRLAGSGSTWFIFGHHGELVDGLGDAAVILTSTRP